MACTDANFKQNAQRTQPRSELLKDMARSQFCLVMPGSQQSSGHLADAFFTGCIPVFLGGPFHTLPLAHLVRPSCFASEEANHLLQVRSCPLSINVHEMTSH